MRSRATALAVCLLAVAAANAAQVGRAASRALGDPAKTSLCDIASQALIAAGEERGLQVEASCRLSVEAQAHLDVPGDVDIAQPVMSLRAGPMVVLLRLRVPGKPPSMLAVPMTLQLRASAWLAQRHMSAGEVLRHDDMVRELVDWPVGTTPWQAAEVAPTGRVLRATLRRGEVLPLDGLVAVDEVAHGAAVAVLVQDGDLVIRTGARVTSNAKVGSPVRAQLNGRQAVVEGVLIDANTVLVGGKQP